MNAPTIQDVAAALAEQRAYDAEHAGDDHPIVWALRPVTLLDTLATDLSEAQLWATEYARRADLNEYCRATNTRKAEKYAATARRLTRDLERLHRQLNTTPEENDR